MAAQRTKVDMRDVEDWTCRIHKNIGSEFYFELTFEVSNFEIGDISNFDCLKCKNGQVYLIWSRPPRPAGMYNGAAVIGRWGLLDFNSTNLGTPDRLSFPIDGLDVRRMNFYLASQRVSVPAIKIRKEDIHWLGEERRVAIVTIFDAGKLTQIRSTDGWRVGYGRDRTLKRSWSLPLPKWKPLELAYRDALVEARSASVSKDQNCKPQLIDWNQKFNEII